MSHAAEVSIALSTGLAEFRKAADVAERRSLCGIEILLFEPLPWFKSARRSLERIGAWARRRRLALSTHAPIYDVNAGSPDPVIREYSRRILLAGVEASAALGAVRTVLHTGWNPLLPRAAYAPWLERTSESLESVARIARDRGVRLCLENFFESKPAPLLDVAETLRGSRIGFCFDLSHSEIFSTLSQASWIEALASGLEEVHVNDCDGVDDAHLALGDGRNRLSGFFRLLRERAPRVPIVLEMSLARAERSLDVLAGRLDLRPRGSASARRGGGLSNAHPRPGRGSPKRAPSRTPREPGGSAPPAPRRPR